jgi:hypothetical protein
MGGGGKLEGGIPARLTPAEGRRFGLTVGTAFAVLGGIVHWRGGETAVVVLGTLATAFILGGVLLPGRMGPVHHAWMRMALAISKVTTPIFMGIVYFIVIFPIGGVMRLFGRQPLAHLGDGVSHWISRPATGRRSDLQRQF